MSTKARVHITFLTLIITILLLFTVRLALVEGLSSVEVGNTNLTIWDSSDFETVYGNWTVIYANFTNVSSGESINGSGIWCEFGQNKTGIWTQPLNFSFNPDTLQYELIADGSYLTGHSNNMPIGFYSFNVSAFDVTLGNENLSTDDIMNISEYQTTLEIWNETGRQINDEVTFTANFSSLDFGDIGRVIWNSTNLGTVYSVAFFDCDNKGKKDCAAVGTSADLYAFYNNGTQKWNVTTPVSIVSEIEAGDLDNDGYFNDLALVESGDIVWVFNESGDAVWSQNLGADLYSVAIGDLDGDGLAGDLVVGGANETIYTFTTSDGVTWQHVWNASVGGAVEEIVIQDLDEDGKSDIVCANDAYNNNVLAFVGANGSIIWNASDANIDAPYSIAIGDIDHDGWMDDVVVGTEGDVYTFTFNGSYDAQYASTSSISNTSDPISLIYELAVLDIDDDGFEDDYVAADRGTSGAAFSYIWALNNDSIQLWNITLQGDATGFNSIYSMSVKDINGDGNKEIILADEDYDTLYILNKTGSLLGTYAIGLGDVGLAYGSSAAIDSSDINGDGINEFAVGSRGGYIHFFQDITCTAAFNDTATTYSMSWGYNSTNQTGTWIVNRSFTTGGDYEWNVTCEKGGYTSSVATAVVSIGQGNTAPTAPNLNSPDNNTHLLDTDLIIPLNWSNSTDADGDPITYYLEIWNDSDMQNILYVNSSIVETDDPTGDIVTFPNESSADFFWRVLATDGNGNSSWSEARNISIGYTIPLPFEPAVTSTLSLPPTDSTEADGNITLECNATATNSEIVNISIYTNFTGWHLNQTNEVTGTDNSTIFILDYIPDTQSIVWNCEACNNESNCSFAVANWSFTVDVTAPAVNLELPNNNTLNTTSHVIDFTFNVSDFSNVDNCSLLIDNTANITLEAVTKDTTQNLTTYLNNGDYQWSVNCTDAINNIGASEVRNLSVSANTVPTTPLLRQPDNDTSFLDSDLIIPLNWSNSTDADGDPITYYLEIWNDSDMQNILYVNSSIVDTDDPTGDIVTFPNESSADFFWRVLATDGNGNSSWSELRSITIAYSTPQEGCNITADNCSALAIQNAINTSVDSGGGLVCIPACDIEWNTGDYVAINTDSPFKVLGAGENQTIISYAPGAGPPASIGIFYGNTMWNFWGEGLIEFGNMTLKGNASGVGTLLYFRGQANDSNLRIHNLNLHRASANFIYFCQNIKATALIDHIQIMDNTTGTVYGIRVTGSNEEDDWELSPTFGNSQALFVEDSLFNGTYHPLSQFTTAYVVVRHNTFTENTLAGLDGHGPGFDVGCGVSKTNIETTGMHKYEIYNNTWNGMNGYNIYQRGGAGIITDNTHNAPCSRAVQLEFDAISYEFESGQNRTDCCAANGCLYSTSGYTTTNSCYQSPKYIWIWNNQQSCTYAVYANDKYTGCLRENQEYYLRAPQAGDTVESYTEYTYPHPLAVTGAEDPPAVTLEAPEDNATNTTTNTIDFTYNVSYASDLVNCSLIINDQINITDAGIQKDTAGQNFTVYIPNAEYNWSINCTSVLNKVGASEIRNLSVSSAPDTAPPVVSLESPDDNSTNTTSNALDFTYNVSDFSEISNCSLIINDIVNVTSTSITKDTAGQNLTTYLDNGEYNWSINCTDSANNEGTSETRNLSVSVSGSNTNPLFEPISDFSQTEDFALFTINLQDNVSDAEDADGSLTYNWTVNDTSILTLDIVNITGIATFTAGANASGSALVTISVVDAGGLTNSTEFTITVTSVNDAPWIDQMNNITMMEDNGTSTVYTSQELNNSFRDVEEDQVPSTLALLSESDTSAISCTLGNGIACTSVANQSGTDTLTIEMNDSSGSAARQLITITLTAVNDAPFPVDLNEPANESTFESLGEFNWTNTTDIDNETIFYVLQVDDSPAFTEPSTYYNGSITETDNTTEDYPTGFGYGVYYWRVLATDNIENSSWSEVRMFNYSAPNTNPNFDVIGDFVLDEDFGSQTINLSDNVSDGETPDLQLSFTWTVNDTSIVTLDIDNGTNIATFTSQANASGSALINITVWDAGLMQNSTAFTLSVNSINDAPWIDQLSNITMNEDNGTSTVYTSAELNNTFRDVEEDQVPTTITLLSQSNSTPVNCSISDGIVCITAANESGANTISIEMNDSDLNSTTQTLTITVSGVNDQPWMDLVANGSVSLGEDGGAQQVLADYRTYFRDVEDDQNPLSPSFSDNETDVSCAGNGNSLECTPSNNFTGRFIVTYTAQDSGSASASQNFEVVVNAVNDQPWWESIPNNTASISEDTPNQNLTLGYQQYFRDVEDDQNPTLSVIGTNETSVTCSINSGDIQCSSTSNFTGAFILTINGSDSGSASALASFEVTVNPANDAPWIDQLSNITMSEDNGTSTIYTSDELNNSFRDVEQDQTPTTLTMLSQSDTTSLSCTIGNGVLCTSVANQSGSNSLTIEMNDSGNNAIRELITITISGLNDVPWWDLIGNSTISINEDTSNNNVSSQVYWQNYFRDVENDQNPAGTNSVIDNSSDVTCALTNGDIICSAANNATGSFALTISAQDQSGGNTIIQDVEVTINPLNQQPWMDGDLTGVSANEDNGTFTAYKSAELNSKFRDVEEDQSPTSKSINSQSDVSAVSCSISGGDLQCTTVANASGTNTVNISYSDSGALSTSNTIVITINAVNDAPWLELDKPDDNATNTTTNTIDFSYTPRDVESSISNCSLIINEETNLTVSGITVDALNNLTVYLTNGEYNWSVNCTDDGNNIVSTLTRNLSINVIPDTTAPVVSLESPEDNATNTTANSVDFSFNVTDDSNLANCTLIINDEINATDTTVEKDTPGQTLTTTLSNGEYNWSINCTDAFNSVGASEVRNLSVNYTSPAVTTSPSSEVIGGGSSPTRIEGTGSGRETATLELAIPGFYEVFEFTKNPDIRTITLSFKKRVSNPAITVDKLADKPSVLPMPEGRTYSYLQITKNVNDEDIDGVIIEFTVPRSWLASKGVLPDEIRLKRFKGGWTTLPTQFKSSDADNYHYEAQSPGLSYFTIGTEEQQPIITQPLIEGPLNVPEVTGKLPETGEEKITTAGEGKSELNKYLFSTVFILAVLLGLSLLWLYTVLTRKRNPPPRRSSSEESIWKN